MSNGKTQGQGPHTPLKEGAFYGILGMNLGVHREKLEKTYGFSYHHFDLNAGCGYNKDAECLGSPLVFLEAVRAQGVKRYRAHFVDRDPEAARELLSLKQVADDPFCRVYNGDNAAFVPTIPDLIRLDKEDPKFALGSVVCDPNGTDLPIEELETLSLRCKRLDFILNYPARTWKRERGAGVIDPNLFLVDLLDKFHKDFWLIQEPLPDCRHEWMILVGRNFDMAAWEAARLYKLDSVKGREIVARSYSKRESTLPLW